MKRRSVIGPNFTTIILSTLALSCGLRIVATGYALAAEGEVPMPANTEMAAKDMPLSTHDCGPEANKDALLKLIREREKNLKEQETALMLRQQDLAISESLVREQTERLVAAEEKLRKTLALADNASERDIGQLTTVYENMKPKSAAEIFETMDARFAAGFLMAMKPANAAAVMSNLTAEKAYEVSVLMAARNARAPKE